MDGLFFLYCSVCRLCVCWLFFMTICAIFYLIALGSRRSCTACLFYHFIHIAMGFEHLLQWRTDTITFFPFILLFFFCLKEKRRIFFSVVLCLFNVLYIGSCISLFFLVSIEIPLISSVDRLCASFDSTVNRLRRHSTLAFELFCRIIFLFLLAYFLISISL